MLLNGEGIPMNKALAAHYVKLSADQGLAPAQYIIALPLLGNDANNDSHTSGVYLKGAADSGLKMAQFLYAKLLRKKDGIGKNAEISAHYFKLAADQGMIEAQLEFAKCLISGKGVQVNLRESERYFQLAVSPGDSTARVQYGIALLSGSFGRFDFKAARHQFECCASSNRFAAFLRNALYRSEEELVRSEEFAKSENIFGLLRQDFDEFSGDIGIIRLLNFHPSERSQDTTHVLDFWKMMIRSSINYLLDVSQSEMDGLLWMKSSSILSL
jgi:TPR repeat protein